MEIFEKAFPQSKIKELSMMGELQYIEDIISDSNYISSINLEFPKKTVTGSHARLLEAGYSFGKNDCYLKNANGPTIVIHKR